MVFLRLLGWVGLLLFGVVGFVQANTGNSITPIPAILFVEGESPTAIPQETPTPTPTNPYPTVDTYFQVRTVLTAQEYETFQFNFDPRTQDLYALQAVYQPREKNSVPVIRGPISSASGTVNINQIPIYMTLPLEFEYSSSFYSPFFLMTRAGNFYLQSYSQLLQISPQKESKLIWQYIIPNPYEDNLFYFRDVLEIQEGDLIPGGHPGRLVALSMIERYPKGYNAWNEVSLVELEVRETDIEFHVLAQESIPFNATSFAKGPDGHLYIAGSRFGYDEAKSEYQYFGLVVKRLEMDGRLRDVYANEDILNARELVYWPADQSFYFLEYKYPNSRLWRLDPENGSAVQFAYEDFLSEGVLTVSPDGQELLWQRERGKVIGLKRLETQTLPTPDTPKPFPTPLSVQATVTPTPTTQIKTFPTPTATPTVVNSWLKVVKTEPISSSSLASAVHPLTGQVNLIGQFMVDRVSIDDQGYLYGIYQYRFSLTSMDRSYNVLNQTIYDTNKNTLAVHAVSKNHRIPETHPGDVLVLQSNYLYQAPKLDQHIWKFVYPNGREQKPRLYPYLLPNQLPPNIADWAIGPGKRLHFITNDPIKIYRLEENGLITELTHQELIIRPHCRPRLEYLEQDHAFYILISYYDHLILFRVSEDDFFIQPVFQQKMNSFIGDSNDILAAPDGKTLYLINVSSGVMTQLVCPEVTPTPIPIVPTPTPVRCWFVLDGFGGIHSTDSTVPKPQLPYFSNYDIVRDLEPDPLGRGWYMLDGYGGIHTSPSDLPKPEGLPYFGFDIARNLEIVNVGGKLEFYMLDGFGGVHSTGRAFINGTFGGSVEDVFRDLEPENLDKGEWLILDSYGQIFSNTAKQPDLPLQQKMVWNPSARGFVQFPDSRLMIIDAYGGRHTNPFHPASDLINGLGNSFYFSFPIVWDVETVPENLLGSN